MERPLLYIELFAMFSVQNLSEKAPEGAVFWAHLSLEARHQGQCG